MRVDRIGRTDLTKLPNVFIIGAPKAGTTSLAAYLSSHPNVFLCDPKEPNYWTKEEPKDGEQAATWSGYIQFYADVAKHHTVRIDASTSYCWSKHAVPDILREWPASKFIFMIRNPLALAPSLHSEEVVSGHENQHDYNDVWKLQSEREQGLCVPPTADCWQKVSYRFVASLGTHLERLLNVIPRAQLHIILFDDFVRDPRSQYLRVLNFLNLPSIEPSTYAVHNPAKHPLLPSISRAIMRPQGFFKPVSHFAKRTLHRAGIRGLRSGFLKLFIVPGKASAPNDQTAAEMKEYFEPEIKLLETLLNRDLSHWRSVGAPPLKGPAAVMPDRSAASS